MGQDTSWLDRYPTTGRTAAPQANPAPRMPAAGGVPTKSQKVAQDYNRTAQQSQLDANQDSRAETSLGIQLTKEEREKILFDRKMRAQDANGGVDTNASEDQAAGHAIMLENSARALDELQKVDSGSLAPEWDEKLLSKVTDDPDFLSYVQSSKRQQAVAALNPAIESIIYLTTGAAANDEQVQRLKQAVSPNMGDTPETRRLKRQQLQAFIEQARSRAGAAQLKMLEAQDRLYGDKVNSTLDKLYGDPQHSIDDIATPDKQQLSSDVRRLPAPEGMSQEHAAWVRGNPNASVQDYIRFRQGLAAKYNDPSKQLYSNDNLAEQEGVIKDYLDYYRENPNAEIPGLMTEEPLTAAEQLSAKIGKTFGEENTAFGLSLANAGSFGGLDALTSGQQKQAWEKLKAANPKADLAGDMLGSIAPSANLTKAVGAVAKQALGREAPVAASLFADTAYNAARGGASAEDGEGLSGAAIGALSGAAGNLGGRTVFRGAQSFMKPEKAARINQLIKEGVDPTTMQRLGFGKAEEVAGSAPIIRGARENANKSWNIAQANKTLAVIGEKLPKDIEAGFDTNAEVNKILNARYNSIRPKIQGSFDGKWRTAAAALAASGQATPLKRQLFGEIAGTMRTFSNNVYDGNTFRDADQKLRKLSEEWLQVEAGPGVTSPSTYHEMGRLANQFRQQLRAQVSRNTPEVATELKKLDTAWARAVRTENASIRAQALKGEGVYSPAELMTTSKMLDTSVNKGASARGKAFMQQEANDAAKVMGSKPIPENASLFQGGAATGMLYAFPGTTAAALAGGYTPGLKRVTQALLASKRPEALENFYKELPPEILAAAAARRAATEK